MLIFATVMLFEQWEILVRGYGVVGWLQGAADDTLEGREFDVPLIVADESHSVWAQRWGCHKLPQIMGGGRPRFAWLLPLAPREPHALALVSTEDAFVHAALERYRCGSVPEEVNNVREPGIQGLRGRKAILAQRAGAIDAS